MQEGKTKFSDHGNLMSIVFQELWSPMVTTDGGTYA